MKEKSNTKRTTLWICLTAMFMALNVAMSSFGVPVPGGHLYLNDIIICTAAIILDPVAAFIVGAVVGMLLCWKCGVYKLYNKALAKTSGGKREEHKEPAEKS